MHALPLGTPLVRKFLRAEERDPVVGLFVCHTVFMGCLGGYLETFLALIFSDVYK